MRDADDAWTLNVSGLPLRVWELARGPDGVRPVVALHGFLDHGRSFCGLAEGHARRWVAPDQRGFGASGWTHPSSWYHFPEHVADLDALIEALCPADADRVDLVGHSMGGTVALLYAAARPERVGRLAVLDGLGPLQMPGDNLVHRMRSFLRGRRAPPAAGPLPDLEAAEARLRRNRRALDPAALRALARAHTRPVDPDAPDGPLRWSFDPQHRVRAPHTLYPDLLRPFIEAVEAPTLVVWAEDGFYPPPFRVERAGWLRSAQVETVPGDHMAPLDDPGPTRALLQRFLDAPEG